MITIIVALAQNRAIGKSNGLLWHIPNDLKRFKQITTGHTIIMGRKTWCSLPKQPLPDRQNIVLTFNKKSNIELCDLAHSVEEALQKAKKENEIFIIGGEKIYRQFMPLANRLLVTHIDEEFIADTFFPKIDPKVWKLTEQEQYEYDDTNDFKYSYACYLRKKQ